MKHLVALFLALGACAGSEPAPTAEASAPVAKEAAPEVAPSPCEKLDLGEAARGTYVIPGLGEGHEHGEHAGEMKGHDGHDELERVGGHKKVNFDMPEGVKSIRSTLNVSEGWDVRLDMGTGGCPHSGQSLVDVKGQNSVVAEVKASELEGAPETFVGGDMWFAHMAVVAETPPASGEAAAYTLEVEVCR
ncbi:MAG: hypothetical protein JXX28_11695 [Deltaproteobacteria bacterium]|nr:hypothetical protein [Deltaproteobacteria bacterium]